MIRMHIFLEEHSVNLEYTILVLVWMEPIHWK